MLIKLHQPYWGAWQKYGWDQGVEGYGVDVEKVKEAHRNGENIEILYHGKTYTVSPKKINEFYKISPIKPLFKTKRGGVTLVEIPRTLLKVKKKKNEND